MDETWTAAVNYPDALKEYKADFIEPGKSSGSYTYTFWKDDPNIKNLFDWFNSPGQEWRVARFGKAMNYVTASPAFKISVIHRMCDWKSLGDFTFVDVSLC
jgi:hypothetical protein